MDSFFDKNYHTPRWYQQKVNRRQLLKSAAGATAVAAMPKWVLAKQQLTELTKLQQTEPWLTLDAVLNHLFPASASGPSAKDINAFAYLYQVMTVQPIEPAEKQFINQGVDWLNNYSQSELKKSFTACSDTEKEALLRAISRSDAGENWLSTLLNYLLEALLTPPIYGGNPHGIGWTWLEHQPGFPLPDKGGRYYEIPGYQHIDITNISQNFSQVSARKDTRKS